LIKELLLRVTPFLFFGQELVAATASSSVQINKFIKTVGRFCQTSQNLKRFKRSGERLISQFGIFYIRIYNINRNNSSIFMEKTIYSNEYKKVINKLKEARLKAGLTQLDVARRLKKHQSYVSKIESRERRLDIIELRLLASLYKKDINYFLKNG